MDKASQISPRSWYRIMFSPGKIIPLIIQRGGGNISLLFMILTGFALVYLWADLFNLGDFYQTGQIMALGLIFGPFLGVSFTLLLSFFLLLTGKLLKPTQLPSYEFVERQPSLFLISGLLKRWGNAERGNRMWNQPPLVWIKRMGSHLYSFRRWIKQFFSEGSPSFSGLRGALCWALLPLVLISLLQLLEFRGYGEDLFSAELDPAAQHLPVAVGYLLSLLKFGLGIWFLFLLVQLLIHGFKLDGLRALPVMMLSLGLTFSALYGIFHGIFAVPFF